MYSKWIKSSFILAVLLISMVSLSMAACPWFIKNELYSAQCGVLKEVPASKGLLANDPGATAVLDPASIKIAPEYGTLVVEANGAFVYDPNPDMKSGTYVTFKYNATNGDCAAKYAGTAKIQVSCKCRPNVKDLTLCLTPATTLDQIKQKLMDAGVDCIGCGAAQTVLDLSDIELAPGRYPYLLKCPGCQDALGWVTLVPGCAAQAPPLEFCAGSVTMADLPGMIQAACVGTGCGVPVIEYGNVTEENGSVSGGYYVAICNPGTECGSWARGDIIVIQKCTVNAPGLTICEGKTLAEVEALIAATCAPDCDEGPALDLSAVEVDATGNVTGGSYTACCYTVGTTSGVRCESCATGTLTVVPKCDCELLGITLEACLTPTEAEDAIEAFNEQNELPCSDCDSTPVYEFPVWQTNGNGFVVSGTYQYTVTCNAAGLEGCDSSCTGEVQITCGDIFCPCISEAQDITVCKVTEADLEVMIKNGYVDCAPNGALTCTSEPKVVLDVTVDANKFVTGGTYEVYCNENIDCPTDTGRVIIDCPCDCKATAPNLCFDIVCLGDDCRTYSYDAILAKVIEKGGTCDATCSEMTLKFFRGVQEINYQDLKWNFPGDYLYKVVCENSDKSCTAQSVKGTLDVRYYCGC